MRRYSSLDYSVSVARWFFAGLLLGHINAFAQSNQSGALVVPAPSTNAAAEAVPPSLKDIKAPVEIPDYWLYLWITLGVLAAVVGGYLLWKYWLKKKFEPAPVPPLPPHARARRRLREAMAHISDSKRFVSEVSDIVRVYLEESFNLRAPERTTEEFLHELQASNRLDEQVKPSLGDFLSRCDMVKFAKYEPTQMELEDLHSAAMRIVEDTEPKAVFQPAGPASPATQPTPTTQAK